MSPIKTFLEYLSALLVAFVFFAGPFPSISTASTYRVGPSEAVGKVSDITHLLRPGDTVEITGDISDSFVLSADGRHDAPITLRGTARTDGRRWIRPTITVSGPDRHGIVAKGSWNVIEGLNITGANESEGMAAALSHRSSELLIRNCRFFNNHGKAIEGWPSAGNITIEYCEFDSNGNGTKRHSVDIFSSTPAALATVRHCYFHDATGGHLLKSHAPRNAINYNWFESPFYSCVQIVDVLDLHEGRRPATFSHLYPFHSDVVGNVFHQGSSPGSKYSILQLGGEDVTAPGTEGDFHIAHNLFLTSRGGEFPAVPILIHGNVDRIRVFNNVFLELGVPGSKIYERGSVWPDSPRTKGFITRRGHGDPIVDGSHNWISSRATGVPDTFRHTLRGLDPLYRDLANLDFRPRKDSPLISAGLTPLPQGRVTDLTPLFEPTRRIHLDLTPTPRRRLSPPSIGPFEPAS